MFPSRGFLLRLGCPACCKFVLFSLPFLSLWAVSEQSGPSQVFCACSPNLFIIEQNPVTKCLIFLPAAGRKLLQWAESGRLVPERFPMLLVQRVLGQGRVSLVVEPSQRKMLLKIKGLSLCKSILLLYIKEADNFKSSFCLERAAVKLFLTCGLLEVLSTY